MPVNRLEKQWSNPAGDESFARLAKGHYQKDREDAQQSEWLHRLERFLSDHPSTAIVAALGIGLAIGWIGKRK